MHEAEVIERARIKKAWEDVMPTMSSDSKSNQKVRSLLDAMEKDEWRFREKVTYS
jgi:hypothetical protein